MRGDTYTTKLNDITTKKYYQDDLLTTTCERELNCTKLALPVLGACATLLEQL